MDLAEFDYPLPPERIAQHPVHPRDAARLLFTPDATDHSFAELPDLLRPSDVVVINTTKVRHARLSGTRADTGGVVEVLLLDRVGEGRWEALIRPARRIRAGAVLDVAGTLLNVVADPVDGLIVLETDADVEALALAEGATPLPPYITEELDHPDDYQTVYAGPVGSAAAPTAGLHFTEELIDRLVDRGIHVTPLNLHVGLGTFRPIEVDDVARHSMHREWFDIPDETAAKVNSARKEGRRIVAIGTTVVRALESAGAGGEIRPGPATTDLFIQPGFDFEVVDALVTNFHIPRSSLIVMVAAFMGGAWREAYETALDRGYRFLSFGDAMLAERR